MPCRRSYDDLVLRAIASAYRVSPWNRAAGNVTGKKPRLATSVPRLR
jgi:hypothetical protein